MANPVIKIVSLDTVEKWVTISSDDLPADGAMPIWDGTKIVWSAVAIQFRDPDGFLYLQPDGVGTYLSPQ